MFFGTFDFKGILNEFWEGLGKLKTSIFVIFPKSFLKLFFSEGQKFEQNAEKKVEEEILELDSGGPQALGERL